MQFNIAKNKYLANTNIRKAISLAVKRKGLVSSLGGNNVAANTLTPPQRQGLHQAAFIIS